MITANEASTMTNELINKDREIKKAQLETYLENVVSPKIASAVSDRQFWCGVDVPAELKQDTEQIIAMIRDYGYKVNVTHGIKNHLAIGWNRFQ